MAKRARQKIATVERRPAPEAVAPAGWPVWLALAALLLIAYWPALTGSFVWDDVIIIMLAKKSLLYFWISPYQPDYWPVTYSVLFVLWNLFHMNGLGYHLVNVALHLGNGALLDGTLRQLKVKEGRLLAVALFLAHPMQVESVAYIFQLKTLLGATFFLASLWLFLKSRTDGTHQTRSYAGSLVCALFALFTKTSTAMLPATLVLAECVLARAWTLADARALLKQGGRALAARVVPFVAVAAAGVAVTLRFNQTNYQRFVIWDAGPGERVLTAAWNLWFYVFKLLVPWDYTVAYPFIALPVNQWTSYLPLLALAGAVALGIWFRRVQAGVLAIGVCFFVLNLVPALGFTNVFFMKYSLVADHWAYLSSLGLLVPLGLAVAGRTARVWPVGWVLVAALAAVSWHESHAFADEETLWQTTLRKNPDSDLGHTSVALLRYAKGDYREALAHYQQAALHGPRNDDAQYGLGRTLQELGDPVQAEVHYRRALALNPSHGKALNGLGVLLSAKKQLDEARAHLERAVELEPDYFEARNNLALLYGDLGRDTDALAQLKVAVQLRPTDADGFVNLGSLYLKLKRPAEAETALRKALSLNPAQALAHFNLGVLYQDLLKDNARAVAALEEGLRLQPGNAAAQQRLAALKSAPR